MESANTGKKSLLLRFFDLTEITTKVTGALTFLLCMAFFRAKGWPVHPLPSAVFFGGMLLMDMAATAVNNYVDSKAGSQALAFSRPASLAIILVLLASAAALGLWLVCLTDLVVLALGALCFACGILYTAGPMPISRMPLGEAVSGLFYGLVIPLIFFYINLPGDRFLAVSIAEGALVARVDLWTLLSLCLLSIAPACATANIMLANNTCDIQRDIAMRRYTLPYYIGARRAAQLFGLLYGVAYLPAVALAALGIVHPAYLLSLLTALPVFRNVRRFIAVQTRHDTFFLSVVNFVWLIAGNALALAIAALMP